MLQARSGHAAAAKEATGTFLLAWDTQHHANPGDCYRYCGVKIHSHCKAHLRNCAFFPPSTPLKNNPHSLKY